MPVSRSGFPALAGWVPLLLPVSVAVSLTAQTGRPSGVVFCVLSVRDLARGWASAATRNLFSLVSILSRMILSSLGCELRWVGATDPALSLDYTSFSVK